MIKIVTFKAFLFLTLVVSGDEALLGRRVPRERSADEVLVEGALDLARHVGHDVVEHGVQVARVRVVRALIRARQVA